MRCARLPVNAQTESSDTREIVTREIALFAVLFFIGLVVVPILIYQVGQSVFGIYGGAGYGDFFGRLSSKIRGGDMAAWFLVLSPYLGWQILRLLALTWRSVDRHQQST